MSEKHLSNEIFTVKDMKKRSIVFVVLGVLWLSSILGAFALARAQRSDVITGENIGFRPSSGQRGADGKMLGTLVVKINGEWVPVAFSPAIVK